MSSHSCVQENSKGSRADQTVPNMLEEETVSLILQGCNLANYLEANIASRPDIVLSCCDDIVKIFTLARERLRNQGLCSYPQAIQMIDANLQEWLRSSTSSQTQSQEMDIIQSQSSTNFHVRGLLPADSGQVVGVRGGEGHSGSDVSDSGNSILSSQKSRKRKDDMEKLAVTVMVAAAPIMGNAELPPEDGFTWRKYGQKEILGSRFPRGYYRCTHQKLYQCPAKKQVQRLNDDPFSFQVTYRGEHMCHKSSTAPLVAPVPTFVAAQKTTTQALGPHFLPSSQRWLSMELGSGSSSSDTMGGGGGTSTVRHDREPELMPVADIADVMFNSGTYSGNSMELIFPSEEPKWEPDDNNN